MILKKKLVSGVTLIEVVVVMCIIGVLAMMIVPACMGYVNRARQRLCEVNCLGVERMYESELIIENQEHNDMRFNAFILKYNEDVCTRKGNVTYAEGKVVCDVHQEGEEDETPIL